MKKRRRTPFKGIIVAGRPVTTKDGIAAGINKNSHPEKDNVLTTHNLEEIDRAEEEKEGYIVCPNCGSDDTIKLGDNYCLCRRCDFKWRLI